MHIAHIIHSLNNGGAQRFILSIIPPVAGRKTRYSVFYFAETKENLYQELLQKEVEIRKYPAPLSFFRPFRCYAKLKLIYEKYRYINLAIQLRRIPTSLLHTHLQNLSETIYILKLCIFYRIPFIWTIHGKILYSSKDLERFDAELALAIKKKISVVITYVGAQPDFLIGKNYSPAIQIAHIPSCIKVADYQVPNDNKLKLRSKLGINFKEFVVGFVGRLSNEKGVDILLHAVGKVLERGNNLKLILVGDGNERKKLERIVQDLNIETRVVFTGSTNHVKDYLAIFDVYVQPSRSEGLPLSILEAMSAGVPVIAADVGGISYAIRNLETGLLIPPENPESIADAIDFLRVNRELREKFIANSKVKVQEFDTENIRKIYENLYEEMIINHR